MRYALPLCLLFAIFAAPCFAEDVKQADPEAVKWFEDAKFGLFVHWGVYSVLGDGEWVMNNRKIPVDEYEKLPPKFNPVKFDAAEWVSTVKKAGIKYITITSKHHDGFAMFDSKTSDYDIVERTPYGKDVLAALAKECEKQGIKLFFYYSPLDWHHTDYYPRGGTGKTAGRPDSGDWEAYKDYYMAQIDELCSGRYGKIGGIWLDAFGTSRTPTGGSPNATTGFTRPSRRPSSETTTTSSRFRARISRCSSRICLARTRPGSTRRRSPRCRWKRA